MAYHALRHGTPRFGRASESGVDHFPLALSWWGGFLLFLMFCFIFALLVLLGVVVGNLPF